MSATEATGNPRKTTTSDQLVSNASSGQPSTQNASHQLPKYEVPSWAGRPPNGCHLDVIKGAQLIQKLVVDEKRAYYFGHNPKPCDFVVEHAPCSCVHAVLVYHSFL